MTSPDGGGVMPRVVTRFGCTSNDGVHVKFLIEENTGHRVVVSMPMRDRTPFNRPQAVRTKKKRELVTPRCPSGVRCLICLVAAALRQPVSRIRGFQRTHERLDKFLVRIDQGLAVRGISCEGQRKTPSG